MKRSFILVTVLLVIVLISSAMFHKKENPTGKEESMVALGDSLTHGVGDDGGQGYIDNLEGLLEEEKNIVVRVKNYAIRGQESDGVVKQVNLTNVSQDLQKADYIILFIGTNDLLQSNGGDLSGIDEKKIAAGAKNYEENIEQILTRIRKENPSSPILFLGLYNPYPDSTQIERIIERWNRNSLEVVKKYDKVKFISTNHILKEKSTEYFSDALHPNEKGYQKITERIVKEFDF
ncbi:Spore germination lipase LipC [Bacillus sp. THAF10]|uniref:DUF459 domain-containing protein n=1 Tax=Bacillus sp. THAF10 TaxID=2587848 RepID=UPI0012A89A5C|nr:GDSL-type esterase/lipase family protein [Bacillus sp. THAF10]QFT89554.1 Spore germination lipase LipC [Bacillus sp. THAF10]